MQLNINEKMSNNWNNPLYQNVPVSVEKNPDCSALLLHPKHRVQSRTKQAHWRDNPIFSYHGHHLQVLNVCPLCGQQLLGDEVGPVCWEPLENRQYKKK